MAAWVATQDHSSDRGSIGIAFWRNMWFTARNGVKNVEGYPTYYMLFNEVWKEA